ncbi:hypothetical protein HH310_07060 [Actinoplanes sp. TBRC 11911]|uniref:Rv3235 family protein n=1 Tax=Actinoplanes sp. TBRC 11911 TaxID=2729386 RepID=UPI00145E8BD5|nr:Rv3235 family protein [Actinoplanes sp. TBRC 11911]NMO50948.1 hypothetical protein [Actinoplanes sp. TBRC 11911]
MRRSVEIAPDGPRPPISLRPVPTCEPPFDDELEPTVWATAHQLTLDWSTLSPVAAQIAPHPAVDAVPGAGPPPLRPAVAGASAEAKHAVARFVRMCVEVLNGYRPAAHMRRLAVPTEAGAVVAQIMATAHRVTEMRRRMQSPAKRPSQRPLPVALVRLRLCEPRPGAVEAAFALVLGDRTWAMALRMEEHQQSWSATTLRLV